MNHSFLLSSLDPPIPLILGVLAAWYLLSSIFTFAVFGHDKHSARRQRRRVPEKRLHLLELIGGFPGAWLAIMLFHHKSRKASFLAVSTFCSLANVVVVCFLIYVLTAATGLGGS